MGKLYKTIYETTDYLKFKKLRANRDPRTAEKIIKSINEVGYVLSPILVNEKFEVIDGQNRLEALKALNLPVHYMVQDGIGIKECRAMNTGQSNWTTWQFIESYADSGNESYIRLRELCNEYKKRIGVEGILFIMYPISIPRNGSGVSYDTIKEEHFTCSEKAYQRTRDDINKILSLGFVDFAERYNMTKRTWMGAVAYANVHPKVDIEVLIRKLEKDPKAVVSCSRVVDQLSYFDDAYNKGRKPSGKVFMASDIQRCLYLAGGATC